MASPASVTTDLQVAATPDQAISSSTDPAKDVEPSIPPTTSPAPTVITSQENQNVPPVPATPSEKKANPTLETLDNLAKSAPKIPKSRPITSDQVGMKILYPPENSSKTHKIDVE